jgi:hypothetical protein
VVAEPLAQHDIGTSVAEGDSPPRRVVEEERFLCAGMPSPAKITASTAAAGT